MNQPFGSIQPMSLLRNTACLAGLVMLSACAIGANPQVSATGSGLAADSRASLATDPDVSADEQVLGAALQRALASQSVTLADDGAIKIDYSIAIRPSSVGIAHTADGKAIWESTARRGYLLDRCRGERARINMAAFHRATGALVHRSTAEMDSCAITPAMLENLAGQMVEETLRSRTGQSPAAPQS